MVDIRPLLRQLASMERDIERLKRREGTARTDVGSLTIVSDAIAVTRGYHSLLPESGVTDNLQTITGLYDGAPLVLRTQTTGHTITLLDGAGNLALDGNCALSTIRDTISLIYDETQNLWLETSRSLNG